jgi:hypothetical protein
LHTSTIEFCWTLATATCLHYHHPAERLPLQTKTRQEISSESDKAEIYIGYEKGSERSGKGRTVVDDPKKYPERNEVVGGWAGGEVGLKRFVSELDGNPAAPDKKKSSEGKGNPSPVFEGKDKIYVGYSK